MVAAARRWGAVRSGWLVGVPEGCAMAVADRIVMLPAARDVGDDAALVARARGGERWAEEALYRRHGPRLLARVARLLGDPSQAEAGESRSGARCGGGSG